MKKDRLTPVQKKCYNKAIEGYRQAIIFYTVLD